MNTDEIYKSRCKALKEQGLENYNLNSYEYFSDLFSPEQFKEIIRLKQNRKNKRYRTKSKYYELIALKQSIGFDKCTIVFGTITLNKYYLSLKENTYIRGIHSWLKKHFLYSILNKDFGKNNEREHYHFIGLTTEPLVEAHCKSKKGYQMYNLMVQDYTMGFEPDLLLVDLQKNDINKTTNYLLKLNNHSSKDTTSSRVRIIKNSLLKVCTEKRSF